MKLVRALLTLATAFALAACHAKRESTTAESLPPVAVRVVASVRRPSSGKKSAIGAATPVRQRMAVMRRVYMADF